MAPAGVVIGAVRPRRRGAGGELYRPPEGGSVVRARIGTARRGRVVLARYFQFYVKKRGRRRTDSPAIGNLALALFFALLLCVGIGFFAVLVMSLIIPEWRVRHRFVADRAMVVDTRARPVNSDEATVVRPEVLITYEVEGANYQTWTYDIARVESGSRDKVQAILDRFEIGREYPCWYDPDDPDTAVLVRDYSWSAWMMTLLPLSLMLVGGGGLAISLLNWGKSAERRAALAQKTLHLDLFEPAASTDRGFPSLPLDRDLTNSPGTTLKFRLPMDAAPQRALFVVVAVGAGVLAGAVFFAVQATQAHLRGRPDWFMTIFAGVWAAAALVALVFVVRNLIRDAEVGTTIIEVSEHPWRPGEQYELFLAQGGHQELTRFDVRLVCEERATYSQGTNTRTEQAITVDEILFHRDGGQTTGSPTFEARCEVRVPARAMHSFISDHNEIGWKLVVTGESASRGGFVRSFPIVMYPAHDRGEQP